MILRRHVKTVKMSKEEIEEKIQELQEKILALEIGTEALRSMITERDAAIKELKSWMGME